MRPMESGGEVAQNQSSLNRLIHPFDSKKRTMGTIVLKISLLSCAFT